MSKYFDELSVGERFATSGRTITETDLVTFVNFMRINNPLFTDLDYARKSIFQGRVVPGPLALTVSMGLLDNLGLFSDSLLGLLSLESRFRAPVKVGDTIRVESIVLRKKETSKPDRGVIELKESVQNQARAEVMSLTRTLLLKRRRITKSDYGGGSHAARSKSD